MHIDETAKLTDQVTRMLAFLCIRELSTLPEQVKVLDRFGLTSPQIAAICGVAEQSVRNARVQIKKSGSAGRRNAPGPRKE